LTKNPIADPLKITANNDNHERYSNYNDRHDPSPTLGSSFIASPKKTFLLRSQSVTEPASPNHHCNTTSNHTTSQRLHVDATNRSHLQDITDHEKSMDELPPGDQHYPCRDNLTLIDLNDMCTNGIQSMSKTNGPLIDVQKQIDVNVLNSSIGKQHVLNINSNKRTIQSSNITGKYSIGHK
jgi:hypothetical protein